MTKPDIEQLVSTTTLEPAHSTSTEPPPPPHPDWTPPGSTHWPGTRPRAIAGIAAGPVAYGRPSIVVCCIDGTVWSGQLHGSRSPGAVVQWRWDAVPAIPEPDAT